MPKPRHPEHFACGQLHAALWTLRLLAARGRTPPPPEDFPKKEQPSTFLKENLAALDNLLQATVRGGAHREAAVAVFREIPDLLPANGKVPTGTMSPGQQNAFADGYRKQRADHDERFGDILS
ncbi:hypothetical protein [Streptomyces sp. PSKA30]|uniref:hypothetical protein n=1 Tax=Streptomyces sp. PSKA30 TaxID=2874597 RepID=UPI001CD15E49|nr:hypothetical protein [Streptomyces sp. PSKA30]MBZ9639664.1 hypothetical protein [Streptomyces sp. PSKA30]